MNKKTIRSKALFAVTLLTMLCMMTVAPATAATTWSSDIRLTEDPTFSNKPDIAVDSSGNAHIAWQDHRDGNYEIYYTKLDNDGNTLVDDTRLTNASGDSMYPSIAMDSSGNVHISWYDKRDGNTEIYYTKLNNVGTTLVDDTRLTTDGASSMRPSIDVNSCDNILIVWQDGRDGNAEIYYTELDNAGNTLVDDTRLTDDPAISHWSRIAVDSCDNIHIAWADGRDHGNPEEIYYKKGTAPAKSDLTPTAITTPASIIAAQSNTIEATIANIGAGNASSFTVSLSADGTPVDTASVDSLTGGASTNVSFSWTPDSAGGYELCVVADSGDAVGESDETNNGMCEDVTVAPPLTAADASIALEIAVGGRPFDSRVDVNGDGVVTSLDALLILMQVATGGT